MTNILTWLKDLLDTFVRSFLESFLSGDHRD
jgi:hypothetical protein